MYDTCSNDIYSFAHLQQSRCTTFECMAVCKQRIVETWYIATVNNVMFWWNDVIG